MITTGLAKLGTGLAARGIGLPLLRTTAFAAMAWGVWMLVPLGLELIRDIDAPHNHSIGTGFAVMTIMGLVVAAVAAFATGMEGRPRDYRKVHFSLLRPPRAPWSLLDFLRRAPFGCWCLIAGDGVPIWAILFWPAITAVDLILTVGILLSLLGWGLWLVLATRLGRPGRPA